MKQFVPVLMFVFLANVALAEDAPVADDARVRSAKSAVERFRVAFNAGSDDAVANVVAFPFVTFTRSGKVIVADDPDQFRAMNWEKLRGTGWRYSTYDNVEVLDVADSRIIFNVSYTRHNSDGPYVRANVLFIVVKRAGEWRITARSSIGEARDPD